MALNNWINSAADGITAIDPSDGRKLGPMPRLLTSAVAVLPLSLVEIFGSCGSGGGGNYVVAIASPTDMKEDKVQLAYEIRRSANYVRHRLRSRTASFSGVMVEFSPPEPVTGKCIIKKGWGSLFRVPHPQEMK